MRDYGYGLRPRKMLIPLALFAAGISSVMSMPAGADSGGTGNVKPGNAMTSGKMAKAASKEAVENAGIAFEKAKTAGAERKAPYEYYLAEEYLLLAREELNEGDRHGGGHFAAESEKYSNQAIERAKGDLK